MATKFCDIKDAAGDLPLSEWRRYGSQFDLGSWRDQTDQIQQRDGGELYITLVHRCLRHHEKNGARVLPVRPLHEMFHGW